MNSIHNTMPVDAAHAASDVDTMESDNAHPNTTSSTEKPAAGKRKASNVSPLCKCGSSDHKRTNHKLCPLNKKKKVVERVGSNVPGAVRDVSEIPVLNATQEDVAASKKPCKCGSTEHQIISKKSCPLYRGTVKERFKVGDEENSFCTVKMGLNQFLACSLEDNEKQALTDVVNDAVQRLTDL
ncbi:hypothetical protein MP638_004044, partial [Amoeboaphelidium occidentale]